MALELGDADQYFDPTMAVSISGRRYVIPPASAELGLWVRRVAARRGGVIDADAIATIREEEGEPPIPDGQTFEQALLGADLVAKMVADGVADEHVKRCALTAYHRILGGDDLAKAYWTSDPNSPSPTPTPNNRAERRAAAKAPKKAASASPTTSTGAAATTRTRASGSGTKSRQTSAATAAKAKPPRGAAS